MLCPSLSPFFGQAIASNIHKLAWRGRGWGVFQRRPVALIGMIVRLEMLGTARAVLEDDEVLALKPTLRNHALAFLAFDGGWVHRDQLGFLFWPDTPDQTARHNVRQLLKRIRKLDWLDYLEVEGDNIRWPVLTDVDDLQRNIESHGWSELPQGSAVLLPGFERNATAEFEDWLLAERGRIGGLLRSAFLMAAADADEKGDPKRGMELIEPLLADDDGHLVLPRYMELATKAGDRSTGLAAFDRVSTRLEAEYGAEPSRQAIDLAERLRDDSEERRVSQRPVIGRSDDVAEIAGLLAQSACRLLTLFGPGGIGKSTLGRLIIDDLGDRFADGSALVSLETISDPISIPSRIAAEVGFDLDGRLDPVDQLVGALRDRQLLVVFDNAEHVPGGWPIFSRLLEACPNLRLVVTSRERLRLRDEWVYPVPGLTDDEGLELLTQLAGRIAPEVTVGREDAISVSQVVGGSPLGIELAVPWLRVMSCAEIVAEIVRDPMLLGGERPDSDVRHRSLEAAMSHSWRLASPDLQEAIEALSVFAAPYSLDLAAKVAGVTLTTVRDLIDKSLVRRLPDGSYVSHPLVRQYAASRLAADDDRRRTIRDRHARVVLSLLETPGRSFEHAGLLDDMMEAWRHAAEQGEGALLRGAVEGMASLLESEGRFTEGLQLMEAANKALAGGDLTTRAAKAAVGYAEAKLLYSQGRHAEAAARAERSIVEADEVDDRYLAVLARLTLGWARKWIEGDPAQHALGVEALAIAVSLADDELIAEVLNSLGCSAPDLTGCRDHLKGGLRLASDPRLRVTMLDNLGMVSWSLGESQAAVSCLEEARTIAESENIQSRSATASLAFVHGQNGELEAAGELAVLAESQSDAMRVTGEIYVTLVSGEILRLLGDHDGARERMRRALSMADAIGNDPYRLRALRLQGQLLADEGRLEEGLRILALVLSNTDRRGDFTCIILNPKIWEANVESADLSVVSQATEWAGHQDLEDIVGDVLADSGLVPT
jgi:predicted ATPase/DNA-binding SARP family transcriptional activator/tetratricopeptide (TPR) repeat protein